MTALLLLLDLQRADQYLEIFKTHEIKQFFLYPDRTDKETGFYYSDEYEEGGESVTSTIYVWVKGVRMSLHFKDGLLDHILAPTTSMVRL
jgi:hypothetical protein